MVVFFYMPTARKKGYQISILFVSFRLMIFFQHGYPICLSILTWILIEGVKLIAIR